MARDLVAPMPNRGLNIVDPPGQVPPEQLIRAENVVFTNRSVRRRLGKYAAYQWAAASSLVVSHLKRFYLLASTGGVTSFFFKSIGTSLYKADTDWSDDTPLSTITAWSLMAPPQTGNNTLYWSSGDSEGYDVGPVAWASGFLKQSVEGNSWCYFYPDYTFNDDTSKILNVPIRTQGGDSGASDDEMFLHGLVPPNPLDLADVAEHTNTPEQWSFIKTVQALSSSLISAVIDSVGDIHVAFCPDPGGDLSYTKRTAGTWAASAEIVESGTFALPSIAVDSLDRPVIAYYNANAPDLDLRYASKPSDSGVPATDWITEDVDTTGTVGDEPEIKVNSNDEPIIVYTDTTNGDIKIARKNAGGTTWSTGDVHNPSADVYNSPSFEMGTDDIPHICWFDSTNGDLLYTTGPADLSSFNAAETVDATSAGATNQVRVDSNNVPHVMYEGNSTVKYSNRIGGTWVGNDETVDSSGSNAFANGDFSIDSEDVPYGVWQVANVARFASKANGTWTVVDIHKDQTTVGTSTVVKIGPNDEIEVFFPLTATPFDIQNATGIIYRYYYALTAEYDDGILGESGPSGKSRASFNRPISSKEPRTLTLTPTDDRYNMTKDVSRIHVSRTIDGATSGGIYHRVGSVDCTSAGDGVGAPDTDLTDSTADVDLVTNQVLDEDVFMPPKYKTAVYWKDRLVVGHTKARDTSDDSVLDYGETTDACIHPNRIRFSVGNRPDQFRQLFWQDLVPGQDSGAIKQLVVHEAMDVLFALMENDVVALLDPLGDLESTLSYRVRTIAGGKGTPCTQGTIYHDGWLFYPTRHGIEAIRSFNGRNITANTIAPLWNTKDTNNPRYADRINMSQLDLIRAGVSVGGDSEYIYWAYPAATATKNDRILALDYRTWKERGFIGEPSYSIYTGWGISCFERWNGEGDRGELFGGESDSTLRPWVYRLDLGDSDYNGSGASSTEVAIPTVYISPGFSHAGRPDLLKAWKNVRVVGRGMATAAGSSSMVVKFDVDEGAGSAPFTLDTFTWPDATPSREVRNIPREAIGVYGAVRLEITDALGIAAPRPWQLYQIAYTVNDLQSRARGTQT